MSLGYSKQDLAALIADGAISGPLERGGSGDRS